MQMFDLTRALAQHVLLRAKARSFVNHLSPDINVGVSQQQRKKSSAKAWRKNRDFAPQPKNECG
jgi:hypothetical protein